MIDRNDHGLTVVELVVAISVMLVMLAGVFPAVHTAPDTFAVQTEMVDMHQRLRSAEEALTRALLTAVEIQPCRSEGPAADPPGTVKPDTITLRDVEGGTTTYWLKADDRAGTTQLMSYAGGNSPDVPVVDHVVALKFEYDEALPIRSVRVTLRVQAAVAALRGPSGALFARAGTSTVASRWAPDLEVRFEVAPRNLNLGT